MFKLDFNYAFNYGLKFLYENSIRKYESRYKMLFTIFARKIFTLHLLKVLSRPNNHPLCLIVVGSKIIKEKPALTYLLFLCSQIAIVFEANSFISKIFSCYI